MPLENDIMPVPNKHTLPDPFISSFRKMIQKPGGAESWDKKVKSLNDCVKYLNEKK